MLSLLATLCITSCGDSLVNSSAPAARADAARLVGSVHCEVQVATGQAVCGRSDAKVTSGQARGLVVLSTDTMYWMVKTANPRYVATDSLYTIDVALDNYLSATLGSRDGVVGLGYKLFVLENPVVLSTKLSPDTTTPEALTGFPLSDTARTVRILNPDGRQDLFQSDLAYFAYPGMLPPGQRSEYRSWQFHVPNHVESFMFTVVLFAATPGELEIPDSPPKGYLISSDSVEALYAPQRLIRENARMMGPYPPDIVRVAFRPGTTREEKQAALDIVRGRVIGGGWAVYYYVLVPLDESEDGAVWGAVDRLLSLPFVLSAHPDPNLELQEYSRWPDDGSGWRATDWQVRAALANGDNWGHEAVEAPLAWGCSTGNDSAHVVIVDLTNQHSQWVHSIIASPAGDGQRMAGMMWGRRVTRFDASSGGTITGSAFDASLQAGIEQAFLDRAHVINFSWGAKHQNASGALVVPNPSNPNHVNRANTLREQFSNYLTALESQHNHTPLYVIAAGNNRVDAKMGGLPQLATDPNIGSHVLVVGGSARNASGKNRPLYTLSDPVERGSNFSPTLMSIVAPGASVRVDAGATAAYPYGTSFAAPYVSAVAGLLRSFDPRLSADSLKILILEGAVRGGWTSGPYPFLNAYEALRAAAARKGAPLCGNPVFQDSVGAVFVKRGTAWMSGLDNSTATLEHLFTTTLTSPDAKHGGTRIRFSTGDGYAWQYSPSTPSWSLVPAMPDTVENASVRSRSGRSHGGHLPGYVDTAVTVTKTRAAGAQQETFNVVISPGRTVTITGPRRPLARSDWRPSPA